MFNLYSVSKGQQAIRDFTKAIKDRTGNLPPLSGVFSDYPAPIVHNTAEGRELTMARWEMPSPVFVLKGRNADSVMARLRLRKHWQSLMMPGPGAVAV